MNIQQCRYVEAIAETGSFSEAAKKLYVTQPNLSSSIKELENELGVQLFFRSNTGARLTDDGNDFLKYAKRILGEIDLLEQRYQQNYRKSFTITSHHYDFLSIPLLEIAEQFKDHYQHFHMFETTTKKILESVLNFESDLGIIYLNDDNKHILERYMRQHNLSFTPLGEFPTRIFLRKGHPLANQTLISEEDLKPYTQVRFRQESTGLNFDEDTLTVSEHQNILYSNDRGTVMNLLCGSDAYASGLGIVNSFIKDQIVLIPLKNSQIHTLGFVTNDHKTQSDITTSFIKSIRQSLADYTNNTR
ncbi:MULTISPECIES: LysR family transcriptional regulator [unclassified Streptococcus]|uniref:LysR family transcriptional regulator n=1 Tax=unclassified Streptococcus TaxID=2608887 RepID=UPI002A8A60F9|nr:LysR family transcriptional regulator [Streptococcus sp.]